MLRQLLSSQTDEASVKYNDFIHELSSVKSGLDKHIASLQESMIPQTEFAMRLEEIKHDTSEQLLGTHRELEATVSGVIEQVTLSDGPVANVLRQVEEQWSTKFEAIATALARVEGIEQSVSKIENNVESRLETAVSALTQSIAGISQSFGSFQSLKQEHNGVLDASFSSLQRKAIACDQSAGDLHQQLSQVLLNDLLDSFTSHSQQITALLLNAFESRITQTQSTLMEFGDDFKSIFEEHAEKLLSTASEVVSTIVNQVEGELARQVQDAFDHLLRDCTTAFTLSLFESIATAQFGASATASLSPLLPQLALAKKAVTIINSFI